MNLSILAQLGVLVQVKDKKYRYSQPNSLKQRTPDQKAWGSLKLVSRTTW